MTVDLKNRARIKTKTVIPTNYQLNIIQNDCRVYDKPNNEMKENKKSLTKNSTMNHTHVSEYDHESMIKKVNK